jgi:hypothetical protein
MEFPLMIFNQDRKIRPFSLSPSFVNPYKTLQPKWGGLGYFTYKRSYARALPEGGTEEWWQTVQRVVEGCFNIQKIHCRQMGLPWNDQKAQASAQEMYRRIWDFKFTPPGRGLWVMGTDLVYDRGSAALQNCAFTSTESIGDDFAGPFVFLMDMSMLGVGVGGDTKGAGKVRLGSPKTTLEPHVVQDSREGWVELVKIILNSFVGKGQYPLVIDYSNVRGRGQPIKTFGGIASGAKPLQGLVESLTKLLLPSGVQVAFEVQAEADQSKWYSSQASISGSGESYRISSSQIVDIFNFIGKAVVSGGVRRSAEIMFGDPDDTEFTTLKQDEAALADRRWACVTGDTMVDTTAGTFPIQDLVGRTDLQVLLNGEVHAVEGVKKTGTEAVYLIETFGGPSLKATHNHLLMTTRNWVPVSDLQVGDRVLVSDNRLAPIQPNWDLESYKHGYLLGALIGDGTYTSTSTTGTDIARIMTYVGDSGEVSLREYIQSIFSFDTRADFKGFSGPHGKGTAAYHFISAKGFTQMASEWGVVRGHKTITQKIESAPRDLIAGVISGLFDADGSLTGDGRWSIDSVDEKMLERLQRMLLRLGIMSRRYRVRESRTTFFGVHSRNCRPVYRLTLAGYRASERLVSLCGIHHAKKLDTWKHFPAPSRSGIQASKPEFTFKVTSVTPAGTEDVFDACVPTAQAFPANGLYVHNSNNSLFGYVGMDYTEAAKSMMVNGEPGLFWLENARRFGRMNGIEDKRDWRALGCNPCGEQTLEDRELCCLVEAYPAHHDSYEDFEKTLKMAYLYAKTVTLVPTHDPRANAVMMRNRRIGSSMSGIIQAMVKLGRRQFLNWCDRGYAYVQHLDRVYSDWLGIPLSIKTTSVKPSGTVSLLCGATPGIHYPHSEYYIRRVRVANTSSLVEVAKKAGYPIEPDSYADDTTVVSFPIHEPLFLKGKTDVTIWEQFANVADLQRHWTDNQVSATISFKPEEAKDIKACLEVYETQLKSVSLLPLSEHGYVQAPYETITKEQYEEMISKVIPMEMVTAQSHDTDELFCTNDSCTIPKRN